ncbi:putative 1,3-beta-glucanosyltransferase [Planoprotostelium fungivorum]|uniref:Putative 1,3-beta-glucanosyltransferase n=1 Tax=Planoprotostelium fungivorum TaxID=1890364 RepID=A0A2P6NCR3_9EUKA|nr:putative 1,3-beta-glucanosyltransferase [Planoprotostelium fungivorum]
MSRSTTSDTRIVHLQTNQRDAVPPSKEGSVDAPKSTAVQSFFLIVNNVADGSPMQVLLLTAPPTCSLSPHHKPRLHHHQISMRTFTLCAMLAIASAISISPIVIKGNKFFNSTSGQQFYIVGVDYQPSDSTDPLNLQGLQRDVPAMVALGVNTIRVYQSSSSADHTAAMNYLADNGIYVLVDATDPNFSINSAYPSWNLDIFNGIKAKIDNFIGFPNLLGFLGGNEVVNSNAETIAAAYVKAAVRDIKAYIKSKGYSIPVGYAATDVDANFDLQQYLNCDSRDNSIDFYGLNTYRYCGDVAFNETSYTDLVRDFSSYSAPFTFTEYGCNQVSPRVFREVDSIYGPNMDYFLSGGFVYEWSQEANNYGLVNISPDGSSISVTQDFKNLMGRLANINPDRTSLTAYNGSTSTVNACPAYNADTFNSQSYPLPPTPDDTVCSCLNSQLACTTFYQNATLAYANATYLNYIAQDVNFVCSSNASFCEAISSNSATAKYGMYSGCNSLQRAAYVLNQYYQAYKESYGDIACTGFQSSKLVTPSANCPNGIVAPTDADTSVTGLRKNLRTLRPKQLSQHRRIHSA